MVDFYLITFLVGFLIITMWKFDFGVYWLIPVSFTVDLFSLFYEQGSIVVMVRAGVILYMIFISIFFRRTFKNIKLIALSFLILIIILVFSSSNSIDSTKSFTELIKTFSILAMFFVGYSVFLSGKEISPLIKNLRWVLVLLISNVIISNFSAFGFKGYYGSGFYTGSIMANAWYAPTLSAIILLLTVIAERQTRMSIKIKFTSIYVFMISVSLIIIIISGRRSALAMILVSLVVYTYFNYKNFKSSFRLLSIITLLAISYPIVDEVLKSQYRDRMNVLNEGIMEEKRYQETQVLWAEILNFRQLDVSLFGKNAFATQGQYGGGEFGDRHLHVDVNIIAFSSGLIGLATYIIFLLSIYLKFYRSSLKYKAEMNRNISKYYKILFYSIFFSTIALSFSGGLHAITYRTMTFLFLGAIIGKINYHIAKIRYEKNNLLFATDTKQSL